MPWRMVIVTACRTQKFSRQQVMDALVAIELDNLSDGIQHQLTLPSLPARVAAITEAINLCMPHANPEVRALFRGPFRCRGSAFG